MKECKRVQLTTGYLNSIKWRSGRVLLGKKKTEMSLLPNSISICLKTLWSFTSSIPKVRAWIFVLHSHHLEQKFKSDPVTIPRTGMIIITKPNQTVTLHQVTETAKRSCFQLKAVLLSWHQKKGLLFRQTDRHGFLLLFGFWTAVGLVLPTE